MSASSVLNPRKPLLWLGLAAGAAIFFASGALAARAVIDTGDKDGTPAASTGNPGAGNTGIANADVTVPRFGSGTQPSSLPANVPSPEKMGGQGMAGADASFYYPGCRAPLPASVLSNGVIDPSKAGFIPNLPSAGFSALQIGLSVYAECDQNGAPKPGGELALDSSWKHDESGIEAYISQRKSEKRVASVLRDDNAMFWADGYVYSVSVNRYQILPYAAEDATRSSIEPMPDGDPRATEVLRTLVAQLTGSDDNMKCFWKLEQGDWSALSGLGIGDPRPQIPGGYTLTDSYISTFTPPAAGCDTSIVPTDGASMNANWQKNGTGDNYGYIGVSAWAMPEDYVDTWPGSFGQYGANWNNGKFQFGVYAKVEDGLTLDTIRAIAKALDPSFNETCLIQERELSDADLARLGFNTPKGPDGYSIVRSSLLANEIGDGCTKPEGWSPQYNLNWTLERGADTIDISVSRYGEGGDPAAGYISPNSIWWTDGQGTYYSINAYSRGISPEVSKDDLVAVAKSLDPSFDESKLSDGGPTLEKPLPAAGAEAR